MSFSLSSTIPADTQEEFEKNSFIFKSILEKQLKEDLATLINATQQVELPWAIGPIAVVNEDTRINLIERILNSLRWFYYQLFPAPSRQPHLPFQRLLEPIYQAEAKEVTSPAYLVVHALTRSYLAFTQPHYHDFLSSVLAREDLVLSNIYSAPFANHVATLIEFQNALRTALLSKEESEVGVWTGTEFRLEPDSVTSVLAREILKEWEGPTVIARDIVLMAHLAVALSYENRWTRSAPEAALGGSTTGSSRLERQLGHAQDFLKNFAEEVSEAEGTLCIFEFASYAAGKGGLEKFAQTSLPPLFQEALPHRAWLSFGRFWSNNEAERLRAWLAKQTGPVKFTEDKYRRLANLRPQPLEQLRTLFAYFDPAPADRFEVLFNSQPPRVISALSVWELLSVAFRWFTARRSLGGQTTLPVAAVGSILKMVEVIYPEHFCCVRINQAHPQLSEVSLKSRVIALPTQYPTVDELDQLVSQAEEDPAKWLDTRLVVARYAAAELLNQRLAFGSGPLKLEFQLNTADEPSASTVTTGWLQAIEWIENHDHHSTLLHYTEQTASPREDAAKDLLQEEGASLPNLADNPWALCIDIGGTGIKGGLYPLIKIGTNYQIGESPRLAFTFATEPEKDYGEITGEGRYSDGQKFAERLYKKFAEVCSEAIRKGEATAEEIYKPIAVIGLTWPGAVSGERGREYVSATSKILSNFSGLTDEIVRNSPIQIHLLRIRENIVDVFRRSELFGYPRQPQVAPLVTLLNDGEAHTLASLDQFDIHDLPSGYAIVLTAGTGTALGVLRDGEPLPFLAEAGKFVIDLAAPFTTQGNFPVGTGNKLFSANTFSELAEQIVITYEARREQSSLPAEPSAIPMLPVKAVELGYYCAELLENPAGAEKCAKEWYESYAEEQLRNPILPPEGKQDYREIIARRQKALRDALRYYGNPAVALVGSPNYAVLEKVLTPLLEKINAKSPGLDGLFTFIAEVAYSAGCLLADLIAGADGLFGITVALTTGGPMSGEMGKLVRAFARHELREGYGYNVVEAFEERRDRYRPLRLRGIYFPEPSRETPTSAAWGAGKAVLELYKGKHRQSALLRLKEWVRSRHPGTRVRLDQSLASQGISRIISEDAYIDIQAADVVDYLNRYKAHLGLCSAQRDDKVIEFIKLDNPDLHVL
ncbi:MAG: hypothetical protein U1F76_08315 [Candidatus Competibacteraceae bacterium]